MNGKQAELISIWNERALLFELGKVTSRFFVISTLWFSAGSQRKNELNLQKEYYSTEN
jgi:hypothetical protein